ncbi:hypothetical protein GW931_00775 [archaeon]|nr:hypothetical protein [archaeon]PJC45358.1 MAG: hypothetical protein CO037_01925 [Candidatus Pacearchaeota archaeon CG_4_9_14_0_2_um_filter_30_8]
MSNLNLVELVDENFNSLPHFINFKDFYTKQKHPKVHIFGFNQNFSKFSEYALFLMFSSDTIKIVSSEEPSLEKYSSSIHREIFRNLNSYFETSIRDENDLNNELEMIKYEFKNYKQKDSSGDFPIFLEEFRQVHKKENILLKYKKSYLYFLENVISSRIKYFYSGEIDNLVNQSKKFDGPNFSKEKLNEYLSKIYQELIISKEDYISSYT